MKPIISTVPTPAVARPGAGQHLIFRVDNLLYAVSLAAFDVVAQGKFQPQTVGDLPCWRGAFDDDGELVPVLALHQLLPLDSVAAAPAVSAETRLVLFRAGPLRCALLADACLGVLVLDATRQFPLEQTALVREPSPAYGAIVQWNGQLVVTLWPAELLTPSLRRRIQEHAERLSPEAALSGAARSDANSLRAQEARLLASPTVEGLMDMGRRYNELGLRRDAERLFTVAEKLESTLPAVAAPSRRDDAACVLKGSLAPQVVLQLLQVAHLKKLTGELVLAESGRERHLYFSEGQIINATAAGAPAGLPALHAALRSRSGEYAFHARSVKGTPSLITARTEQLIREAAATQP